MKQTTTLKKQKVFPDSLFKRSLLALAIAGLSNSSLAQETPEEKAEEDDTIEVISIKGIRGALATAAEIKREADTFVDSITASDVASLPDLSVAEALSRVPGVTVTRFATGGAGGDFPSPEGSGNLVRGLGFVRSEFNGRDAFSANGGRALDWAAIPPELIGGVDVYKNQSADLIEGGIGGTINLRTLEPFDREGKVAVFSANTIYTDLREEWSPSYSMVLGDRWKTKQGEFGLLGSYSTSDLKSEIHGYQVGGPTPRSDISAESYAGEGIPAAGSTIAVVPGFQLRTNQVDRTRDSYYLAGQWQSSDNKFKATVKYVRVENESSNIEQTTESFPDANAATSLQYSDLVVKPFTSDGVAKCNGMNEASIGVCDELIPVNGGLMEEGLVTDSSQSWAGIYGMGVNGLSIGGQNESMTDDISLNLKWRPNDSWLVEVDGHKTSAEASAQQLWVGTTTYLNVFSRPDLDNPELAFSVDPRLNISTVYDVGDNQVPYTPPTSASDPGGYFLGYVADSFSEGEGDLYALRGDVEYTFDDNEWFESVKFGARYSEREQINKSAGLNWQGASQPWNGGISRFNAFDTEVHEMVDFSDFFRDGVITGENQSFLYIDPELLRNPNKFFEFYENEPDFRNEQGDYRGWSPVTDNNGPRRTTDGNYTPLYQGEDNSGITEQTVNLYVRLDFEHEFSNGTWLDGNFGLRYTKTSIDSPGTLQYSEFDEDKNDIDLPQFPQAAEDRDAPQDFLPETTAYLLHEDVPQSVNMSDDYVLPSFNVKWNLNDDMLIRFGASKGMTRPDMGNLGASQSINAGLAKIDYPPLDEDDPNFEISRGFQDIGLRSININGGNPNLRATTATSWDVSYEWYFEGGSFSAALFGKAIENIISYNVDVRDTIILDGQTVNVQYVGPINQADADINGVEIAYQQFFDELPGLFSNLGIQTNYTYIDSSATPPPAFLDADDDGLADPGSHESNLRFGLNNLLGQSRHTANLIGIYQDDKFEARLAYNWRSEYLNSYREVVTGNPVFQDSSGFLDLSLRYDITDQIQLSFSGANILDTKSKSSTQVDQSGQRYQRSSFLNDRRFQFSVRYHL